MAPLHLKVFLSSPGDVAEERCCAREIIERLPREPLLEGRVTLEVVAWDSPEAPVPLASGESPQDSVNRYKAQPGDCDLTVVILWSRLGTPLPDSVRKPDGTPYRSGTEWEYEDARAKGREVWVYQRTEERVVQLGDPEHGKKKTQYKAVLRFIEELRAKGGVNPYETAPDFARKLERHLKMFIRGRLGDGHSEPRSLPVAVNTAPRPPITFVNRPAEVGALKRLVLAARSAPGGSSTVALTTAFQGGGGFGKTTLAQALCHDDDLRAVFPDAILWIELGETPELPRLLARQVELVTGSKPTITDERTGEEELRRALEGRAVLVVLDDVWNPAHARPFLQAGPRGAHLVTTRSQQVATLLAADAVAVNQMGREEAVALLAKRLKAGLEIGPGAAALRDLTDLLGGWPLALSLAAGHLVDLTRNAGLPLDQAIGRLRAELAAHGVTALDAGDERSRHTSVAACIEVSLARLGPDRERVLELGAFPEDTEIPFAAIDRLWCGTAALAASQLQETRKRARLLSLFDRYDEASETLRLHDVVRSYLREQLGERRATVNGAFVDEPGVTLASGGTPLTPLSAYLWRHLGYHLVEAGRQQQLRARLFDVSVLAGKLAATDVNAVLADFDILPLAEDEPLRLLQEAIRLSAHVLDRSPEQLVGQLRGRLLGDERAELRALAEDCRERSARPAIIPLQPRLTPPGGPLLRTFEGHAGKVRSVTISADGKSALSGSHDRTAKLWDLATGRVLRTFEGHAGGVNSVAMSADERSGLSGSGDGTVKLWDLGTGRVLHTFEGHAGSVNSVAMSADGKSALSGFGVGTVKLWDLATGRVLRTFEGHAFAVNSVAMSADGKSALSGSADKTMKLWDLATGRALRTFEGHEDGVMFVAMSADGKNALSGSDDRTAKLWDLATGRRLRTFAGHTGKVRSVTISADGKSALSGSFDKTMKLWDLATGRVLRTFEGHEELVMSVAMSADGKGALSGAFDGAVKLWDLATGRVLRTFEGHARGLNSVAMSADGRSALSSNDRTVKLWDLASGGVLRTFEGHAGRFNSVSMSADGKSALSGFDDTTVKLWDLVSGGVLRTFEGHTGRVMSVAMSADGKSALSGSLDGTVKLWDLVSGGVLRTFEGHAGLVTSVAMSVDGKSALSGSVDKTVKLWDLASGRSLATFTGEAGFRGIAVAASGSVLVAGDELGNVHVLELLLP